MGSGRPLATHDAPSHRPFDPLDETPFQAGCSVHYPANDGAGLGSLCCGLSFDSRGCEAAQDDASAATVAALRAASDGGRRPIVCDTSPCAAHLMKAIATAAPELEIHEPVGFVERYLVDALEWTPTAETVAVHVPCSSKKLGLSPAFHRLASKARGSRTAADVLLSSSRPREPHRVFSSARAAPRSSSSRLS
jgi:hypothetical protein